MRAILVVNDFASTTTPEVQTVISAALEKHLDLTVRHTSTKNDATKIAAEAVEQNFELVIGLGGDGTLNELANGILNSPAELSKPILAGIPGGNANVFLRNLGYSDDPVTATAQLMNKLELNSTKVLGVGKLNYSNQSRWFLFNAGFGIDANVLTKMEARRYKGKAANDLSYLMIAIRELINEIRKNKPTLRITDQDRITHEFVQFALVINFSPWTYFGSKSISPLQKKSDTTSLDLFASRVLTTKSLPGVIKDLISGNVIRSDQQNLVLTEQKRIEFSTELPIWAQVDGEAIAKITDASIEHYANCLTVLA